MPDTFLKDPNATDKFHVVWCTLSTGLNDGSAADKGKLQSATISSSAWTVPSGITKEADDTDAVSIQGVTYGVDTVANISLSGGTAGSEYDLVNRVVTSDARTLDKTITIKVEER
jgi:hypothetical protein